MRILFSLPLVVAMMSSVSFAAEKAKTTPAATGGATKYTYKPVQQETHTVFMPTIGTTFSQILGDDQSTSFGTGFSAGMTADIGEGTTVFHTGLLYSQLNSDLDMNASTGISRETITISFTQNFITAPLQAKTYFNGSGGVQPYVTYGGALNFLMSAKAKAMGQSQDIKEAFNTMNILASVGVGAIIPMNDNDFTVDASFSRSLTGINSKGDKSVYNAVFMLNAGMAL